MSEHELWNELGNMYLKSGAVDEAIRTFQKVIEENPVSGQPFGNLGAIFASQGRYAEAIPLFQKGIELTPAAADQAFLWDQLGDAYRRQEDYTHACAAYRKAIELDPRNVSFQKKLTDAELSSRTCASTARTDPKLDGCLPTLQDGTNTNFSEMAEVSPISPMKMYGSVHASTYGLLRLGILHWRNGDYERAIRFLRSALDTALRSQNQLHAALSNYAIAQVETDLGRIEAAIQAYQSAANQSPEKIFTWNNLGDLYCMLGRYEEARTSFQKAIDHNPKDPVSWNGLGDLYHKLGRYEDAISAYQLGNVFERQVTEEDAFKQFEKSLVSDQENPQVWNEAGTIYFEIEAYEDAIISYRKACELDPANVTYRANLAQAEQALETTKAEVVSNKPETMVKIIPEALPHSELFVAEIPPQETSRTKDSGRDSTRTRQVQKAEAAPGELSSPADDDAELQPEPAFWLFNSFHPHDNDHHPAGQYLPAQDEAGEHIAKPLPAFSLQAQYKQAFSRDQALTDTIREHASLLVQLPPRELRPPKAEAIINIPVPERGRENSRFGIDSAKRQPSLAAGEDKASGPVIQKNTPDDPPAGQPAPDLHVLENDIAAYRRVIEINPDNDRAWDTLGNTYENAGLHSQAIAAFEQAIVVDPKKEVYHYHLGIALGYQKEYDKAIQALQTVVSLNPHYMLAHCALAGYYRKLGKEAEAQEHAQIARSSMETENEYNQACFESICGNADQAIALLDIALEKKQIQPEMVRSDPDLDFIRSDPRFETLLIKNRILTL
jgi:superkiller protein 3